MTARKASDAAPLRRIDWRFLLPHVPGRGYDHAVVLGAPESVGDRLRETGAVRTVTNGIPAGSELADLIAVLDGASCDLRQVVSALRPGGVLYLERRLWRGPPRNGRGRNTPSALRRAGLDVHARYAVLPDLDAPKAYVPFGARGPAEWLARTLVPASTPTRRALRGLCALPGPGVLHRGLGAYPFQAIVARRAPAGDGPAGAAADRDGRPGALALATGGLGPDGRTGRATLTPATEARPKGQSVHVLLLCDAGNRVVLLPFPAGSPTPAVVIKVPKLPALGGRTRHEQESLVRIRGAVPSRLLTALPEPRGLSELDGIVVAVESYLPGTPLLTSSGSWRASRTVRERDLRAAADWLADFHVSAPVELGDWNGEQRERWVEAPLRDYRGRFGASELEERGFSELRRRAEALDGLPFPLVWWHRDFNVWNLLLDDAAVRVIDWEGARPGPPLCDLLHFCTHWHETVLGLDDEADRLDAFQELFTRRSPARGRAGRAVDEALSTYMVRLGLDPGFLPVLLAFTWIELALRRDDQLRDQGVEPPIPRDRNRNFPYVAAIAGWLAGGPTSTPGTTRTRAPTAHAPLPAEPRPVLDASVIVASRNRPDMLADSVRSILAGDALPAELIVIDQSDEPHPALKDLPGVDGCDLRYVWSDTRGLSRANNLGAELAQHEILVFTHDDVLVTPAWLGAIVAAVERGGARAVVTGRILAGPERAHGGYAPTLRTGTHPEVWAGRVLYDVLKPLNMAMTRTVLREVDGFDVRLGPGTPFPGAEDADLGHRLLAAGCSVAYHPEAVLYHRAWRTESDFLPVRWAYGVALGGFYAKHLRWRDLHIPKRIAKDVVRRVRRFPARLFRERRRALGDPLFVIGNVLGALRWTWLHRRGGAS